MYQANLLRIWLKLLNSKLVKQGFQLNSLKRKFESFALKYTGLSMVRILLLMIT